MVQFMDELLLGPTVFCNEGRDNGMHQFGDAVDLLPNTLWLLSFAADS